MNNADEADAELARPPLETVGAVPRLITRINLPVVVLSAVLAAHVGLVAWADVRNAPNIDEAAHLVAGIRIWRFGRFDAYMVNPPLVRLIAAVPMALVSLDMDWSGYETLRGGSLGRPEWSTGLAFLQANRNDIRGYFAVARWACIPFSAIGGFYCWRWARDLYGSSAGLIALLMWSFSPNVITWSSTICPDSPAAALGVAASYYFWRWLRHDDWPEAILAGIALGLALLTKLTWIILFAVWPVLWLAWLYDHGRDAATVWKQQGTRLAALLLLGLLVLNLGYLFEGAFKPLGDFNFTSRTLAGNASILDHGPGGNPFTDTWLGRIPLPFPKSYVEGVDLQKTDFERGMLSYLLGQWSDHGWWYYYLVCAAVKVPLGTWLLGLLAVGTVFSGRRGMSTNQPAPRSECRTAIPRRVGWLDELVLILPAIVLFVFVSSQTGFSRHFRYVLPAFPFVFVWISRVASGAPWNTSRLFRAVVVGSLAWGSASSLWVYPHSMSYFNELAGGPENGHHYLLHSNLDWGQDIYELAEWFDAHPDASPRYILFCDAVGPRVYRGQYDAEIVSRADEPSIREVAQERKMIPFTGLPGWYAVSVNRLYGPEKDWEMLREMEPIARVGDTIRIYKIDTE